MQTDLHEHERFLRGLCYRMTGSAADAEDLVQETFLRAVERPPARLDTPLRPWLVRVAVNLAKDHLRKRKRRAYKGPWLPSPVETSSGDEPPAYEIDEPGASTVARYDLLESVSFAFLLALETLTPSQRAVLLLRDVFDYSVKETAEALHMSEPNVKTTHHRARRAVEPYESARTVKTPAIVERSKIALMRFLQGLAEQDVSAVEALLAEDVQSLSDGGGVYLAAGIPILGKKKVARLWLGLVKKNPPPLAWSLCTLNGSPALVIAHAQVHERIAPLSIFTVDVDQTGKITRVLSVLAPDKLSRIKRPNGT